MKWLTNTYDPKRPDAPHHVVIHWDESEQQAWQNHLIYLKDKIIGDPQGNEFYSTEQLRDLGMVGVYST